MRPPKNHPRLAETLGTLAFISALALFLIQPVVGEILTPSWGGTPTVWLACLLFFQIVLFIGYFLAWIGSLLYPRGAFLIYLLNLVFGLLLLILNPLPLEPESYWINSQSTSLGVVGYLGAHLFVIILGLSTTSTLLQHVLSQLNSGKATQLYAYSNAGSFLALLAFPLIIEPNTSRIQQIQLFTFLVSFQTILGFFFWLQNRKSFLVIPASGISFFENFKLEKDSKWWILIPICTSGILCGVTNHLATEIASVPFLWILPLAIYLLSYVIAFSNFPDTFIFLIYRYFPIFSSLLFFLLSLTGLELASGTIIVPLFIHFGCLFFICVLLHHLLYEKRPKNESTEGKSLGFYYCLIALGGLLGTLLQAIAFPVVFARLGVWEYPLAMAAGIFLLGCSKNPKIPVLIEWAIPATIPFVLIGLRMVVGPLDTTHYPTLTSTISGILFFGCLALAKDGRILGTSLIISFLCLILFLFTPEAETEIRRNTFGVLKISKTQKNGSNQTLLYHGSTIHGIQSEALKDSEGRFIPLSYYGSDGPAGDAFSKLQKVHSHGVNIAIIGLGAGSMAWFGRPQDQIHFFELDPAVGEIAENPKQFQFLSQCASPYRIHFGDGRRILTANTDKYNLLILDAFSSDTVPIHLLTLEALEGYWKHLEPNGTLLCHVSNRHFDLLRLMKGWEKSIGIAGHLFDNRDLMPEKIAQGFSPSQWVIFTKDRNLQQLIHKSGSWQNIPDTLDPVIWTDDHHSILGLLKW